MACHYFCRSIRLAIKIDYTKFRLMRWTWFITLLKRTLGIIGCLAFVTIALLFVIPTLVVVFHGGFRWQSVTSAAPDGASELIVTKRIAFPANEWVDPSVIVRAELRDKVTRRVLASEQKRLVEDSDFNTPVIQWSSDEVRVISFDRRKDQSMTLKHQLGKSRQPTLGSGFSSALRFASFGPAWLWSDC